MPDRSVDPNDGSEVTTKRNLPSWMSSKGKADKSVKKHQDDACEDATNRIEGRGDKSSSETSQGNLHFSKLLEGVVFVLSGFVNPERSTLRSQALEMGAEYRPDWTSDCTLLICAFPNTPKFRQVELDCGTIVSKEWVSECFSQKKLVDIERHLMHAGKPWRKNSNQLDIKQDKRNRLPEQPQKQVERGRVKLTGSAVPEGRSSNNVNDHFSPSKIKEWAVDDLRKTMSWLESQDEKPEAKEVKAIAIQGIVTCLEDAIESLKQNDDIQLVTEQWKFVPRVVKELAEFDSRNKKGSVAKNEVTRLAATCKEIYETELHLTPKENKKQKTCEHDEGYDSDQTIEMTQEEIDLACKNLTP